LIHFYEGYKRPALGWPNAEGYIASSPGIPHAFHMQAHLAMRIGKWEKTTDRSVRAIELERAYHRELNVNPKDDFQFVHHLETLTLSLVHDGRFAEARDIQKEARGLGYKFNLPWFRMHLAEHDWDEANKIVAEFRKSDKPMAAYLAALLYLDQGETVRAAAEVDVLRQAQQAKKSDRRLEQRLWETQGRLLCQQGSGEAGLKLLLRAVNQTKDDYLHHAWAGGAYYMEAWGTGALECGNAPAAEEAFLEALAHDAGSVRAALGLQALCERLGRTDEAHRYTSLAHRLWTKADPKHFELLRDDLVRRATHIESPASSASSR
jgi:Tfp pilus assembly protein PilF